MATERVELYYCNPSENSDKVYILELEEVPKHGGFHVIARYGRRPTPTHIDKKTKDPVNYAEARSIFDRVLREKLKHGYTANGMSQNSGPSRAPQPGPAASVLPDILIPSDVRKPPQTAPAVTASQTFVGTVQPELLTPVEIAEAGRFVADDRYWLQEKRNGRRLVVRKLAGQIFGMNKLGERIGLDGRMAKAMAQVKAASFVVDGEIEGTKKNGDDPSYWVWDLLEIDGLDLRRQDYEARYIGLEAFAGISFLNILPSYRTEDEKRDALLAFAQARKEGVVFKDSTAAYAPGRAGQHFKLKFTKSCTCRVKAWNTETSKHTGLAKRSVFVELLDDNGDWIEVGGVSIAPRYAVNVGDLIEVRFLYATADRRLYQPSYLGKRDDVRPEECTLRQLVFREGIEAA